MKKNIKKYLMLNMPRIPKKKDEVFLNKEGFTLVETLVAVVILLMAVVGPMRISSQGAALGFRSKDQLIASYLAQDALEFVRYKIITNMNTIPTPASLVQGLDTCVSPNKCDFDTVTKYISDGFSGGVITCGGSPCGNLKWKDSGGGFSYYGIGGIGTLTDFRREITITKNNTGPLGTESEWYASSTVYWGKLGENSLTVGENIVDWRIIYR